LLGGWFCIFAQVGEHFGVADDTQHQTMERSVEIEI
jgi:hypothetical protein